MSEVLKWMALGEMTQRSRIGGGTYVLLADLDAERSLRLEAERQVGELREQIAKLNEEAEFCDRVSQGIEDDLRAKLDTAMGLLLEVSDQCCEPGSLIERVDNFIASQVTDEHSGHALWCLLLDPEEPEARCTCNTTSTEGKDHE